MGSPVLMSTAHADGTCDASGCTPYLSTSTITPSSCYKDSSSGNTYTIKCYSPDWGSTPQTFTSSVLPTGLASSAAVAATAQTSGSGNNPIQETAHDNLSAIDAQTAAAQPVASVKTAATTTPMGTCTTTTASLSTTALSNSTASTTQDDCSGIGKQWTANPAADASVNAKTNPAAPSAGDPSQNGSSNPSTQQVADAQAKLDSCGTKAVCSPDQVAAYNNIIKNGAAGGDTTLNNTETSAIQDANVNTVHGQLVQKEQALADTANDKVYDLQGQISDQTDQITGLKAGIKNGTSKDPTGDATKISSLQDSVNKENGTLKTDKEDAKTKNAALAKETSSDSMYKEKAKTYGGKYGGASIAATEALNQGVTQINAITQMVGQGQVSNANASATTAYINKGTSATNTDAATAQSSTLNAAASAAMTAGYVASGAAMTQMYRAYQHYASEANVDKTATSAQAQVRKLQLICKPPAGTPVTTTCTPEQQKAWQNGYANINANLDGEKSAQSNEIMKEGMAAAITTATAMKNFETASMDKTAAAAVTASASNFSFNPGTGGGYSGDGTTTDPTPAPGETLASGDAGSGAMPSANQINPNNDNGLGGTAPLGAFAPAAASQSPAAAAAGAGTAGGTTAAKDDPANKDGGVAAKAAVGSYSSGDGPGYTRNAGNGGPSVGLDTSFADMMKKFLPGGEDEKKKDGSANFDDRSPASDSAAVIARNKNIFEEIHKRYEKKNTEGAIVF